MDKYDTVDIVNDKERALFTGACTAMERWKERMARFMIGRYGMDQLSKMVNYISFALLILTLFTLLVCCCISWLWEELYIPTTVHFQEIFQNVTVKIRRI